MRRSLSIRSRLALMLVVTAVVPLVLASILLSLFTIRVHEDAARERFGNLFRGFEQQLQDRTASTERAARILSERSAFIAEVSLIHRYLVPAEYDPLVFEPALRSIAQALRDHARASDLDRLVLYDGHGRLVAQHCTMCEASTLFVEYRDSRPAVVILEDGDEADAPTGGTAPEGTAPEGTSPFVRKDLRELTVFDRVTDTGSTGRVQLDDQRLITENLFPVVRKFSGGDSLIVGYLLAGVQVFLMEETYTGLENELGGGFYRSNYNALESSPDHESRNRIDPQLAARLDAADPRDYGAETPLFLSEAGFYFSAYPKITDEDETIWVHARIRKDLLQRETRNSRAIVATIFAISVLLVIPIGFYLGDRYFGRPSRELIRAATALRAGDYSARVDLETDGDLGMLAESFNEMAATIENHTGELEERVRERTGDLENALSAKSRFLARVTHEIRNPLNGIMGMAQIIDSSNLNEEDREFVEIILTSSEHLLTIVNDILDYSKIEAGRLELQNRPFSPAELVTKVARLLQPQVSSKSLELVLDIENDIPPRVIGDPDRLRQVLANLVSNASKFTDEGQIRITLRSEQDLDSTSESELFRLHVSVADTGIGISRDKIDLLFTEYAQIASSGSRNSVGTGLGLSIVKELVELMGGSVSVESTVGEGSVFSFHVVVKRDSSSVEMAPEPS